MTEIKGLDWKLMASRMDDVWDKAEQSFVREVETRHQLPGFSFVADAVASPKMRTHKGKLEEEERPEWWVPRHLLQCKPLARRPIWFSDSAGTALGLNGQQRLPEARWARRMFSQAWHARGALPTPQSPIPIVGGCCRPSRSCEPCRFERCSDLTPSVMRDPSFLSILPD